MSSRSSASAPPNAGKRERLTPSSSPAAPTARPHRFFRSVLFAADVLLVLSILLAAYGATWEYATRRYLKGFSDAIIPASASGEEKIEAILQWMAHGPARWDARVKTLLPDRDPTDTLNNAALLQVCGSATNAFVNLADTGGLSSRRLLLLDSHGLTKHVVAEVLVNGRWIVVDPAYRVMWRGADGGLLTRRELADPAVFAAATRAVQNYSPAYTFESTTHVRLSRLWGVGKILGSALDHRFPNWQESAVLSLLLERESLATLVTAAFFLVLFAVWRAALRWYGGKRLGVQAVRIRDRVRQAWRISPDAVG